MADYDKIAEAVLQLAAAIRDLRPRADHEGLRELQRRLSVRGQNVLYEILRRYPSVRSVDDLLLLGSGKIGEVRGCGETTLGEIEGEARRVKAGLPSAVEMLIRAVFDQSEELRRGQP